MLVQVGKYSGILRYYKVDHISKLTYYYKVIITTDEGYNLTLSNVPEKDIVPIVNTVEDDCNECNGQNNT